MSLTHQQQAKKEGMDTIPYLEEVVEYLKQERNFGLSTKDFARANTASKKLKAAQRSLSMYLRQRSA